MAGVINLLAIKPCIGPPDVAKRIDTALRRHAEREAAHIKVEVRGSVVTLNDRVDSPRERHGQHRV